jgi:hypothetical protein
VFGTNTDRRVHSSKLQHRAPLKVPSIGALATLEKPLIREFLFYPEPVSLEPGGQWPVCCAGASPTEVRCALPLQPHISFIVDLSEGTVKRKAS